MKIKKVIDEGSHKVTIIGAGTPTNCWGDTNDEIKAIIPDFDINDYKVIDVTAGELKLQKQNKDILIIECFVCCGDEVGEHHCYRQSVVQEWNIISFFKKNGIASVSYDVIAKLDDCRNFDDSWSVRFIQDGPKETKILKTKAWSEPCFENVFEEFWSKGKCKSWKQTALERFHSQIMTEETDWEGIYGYDL